MSRNWLFLLMAWCTVALIAGGGGGCESGPPRLIVQNAEVIMSPVMLGVGSVYMKVVNEGKGSDVLVGARVAIPDTITELHDVKDGRMVKTDAIKIPAGDTVKFLPNRRHLMVFKMPRDMKAGTEIILVLSFERSGERTVSMQLTNDATNASQAGKR